MKKLIFSTTLLLCIFMLAGCNRNKTINTEEVDTNTVMIKNDGSVEEATIEAFDKDYYNIDELQSFIVDKINEYKKIGGDDAIVLGEDDLKLIDGNAVLVLKYKSLKDYNAFTNNEVILTSAESAKKGGITLPDTFMNASDGSYVSTEVALKNSKYKVIVIDENTDVLVDGVIKYFSNATLLSKNKIQTGSNGETVIVYKP